MRIAIASLIMLAVALSGCASRRTAAPPIAAETPVPPPVDVTALIRHGCFHCLERALDAAEGHQRFEVAALLTLRAKELGLPYAQFRAEAGAAAPAEPSFATYLQIIDAIPVDPLVGERYLQGDATASATRADRGTPGAPVRLPPASERTAAWRDALRAGAGSELFREYLDLAMTCSLVPRADGDRTNAAPVATEGGGVPLLRYRAAICGGQGPQLRALRETDPEFVDADFTLARYAMGTRPADLDEALRWIQSARGAFPASVAMATALGEIRDEREEWAEALAAYDAVLTAVPEHRDALLGRTVALSHLARYEDAIASATRMIELGAWFIGEAHYWRAWNEFSLQRYPSARADADRAKSLMVNAAVFVLSGLIEWNERRLPTAESEFEEALKMDFGRCDAARFLGRVRAQRNKVPEALAALRQAIQCFDLSITVRRKVIADIQAGPGSEATKARLATGHQRAIDDAVRDREECAQNVTALEKHGTQ